MLSVTCACLPQSPGRRHQQLQRRCRREHVAGGTRMAGEGEGKEDLELRQEQWKNTERACVRKRRKGVGEGGERERETRTLARIQRCLGPAAEACSSRRPLSRMRKGRHYMRQCRTPAP